MSLFTLLSIKETKGLVACRKEKMEEKEKLRILTNVTKF